MTLASTTVKIADSVNPKVYNIPVPNAGEEVEVALSPATRQFIVRVRGIAQMKVAFASGESGSNYITVPAGAMLKQDGLNFTGKIYLQLNQAGQLVEVLEWT